MVPITKIAKHVNKIMGLKPIEENIHTSAGGNGALCRVTCASQVSVMRTDA